MSDYDNIPYFSNAFSFASAQRLNACANFIGITPPHYRHCRVLEIGCSFGGNIIPFALDCSESKFVGIDLSKTQIDTAKNIAKTIGLKNVDFLCKNILDLNKDSFGGEKFDYIIVHGVYSWVPKNVQKAILRTIKEHLSKNGVAYVSYNVYPGWHLKEQIRQIMLMCKKIRPDDGFKFAMDTLGEYEKFLHEIKQKDINVPLNYPVDALIFWINEIRGHDRYYIEHEFLEGMNEPLYFSDFCDRLSEFELAYLVDANLHDIVKPNTGLNHIDEFVRLNFNERILQKTMMDILKFQTFHKSLIVHKEAWSGVAGKSLDANDLDKINLINYFTKGDDGFYYNKTIKMNPNFNFVYDIFCQLYPRSIRLCDIIKILKNNNLDSKENLQRAYLGFLEVLKLPDNLLSVDVMPKVEYDVGFSALDSNVVGYFEYFAKNQSPDIGFAGCLGETYKISPTFAKIALMFDGKRTKEQIAKEIFDEVKESNLVLKMHDKEIKTDTQKKKYIKKSVEEVASKLSELYYLKPIVSQ